MANHSVNQPYADLKLKDLDNHSEDLKRLHERLQFAKKLAHPLVDNGRLPDFSDNTYLRILAVVEQLDHGCEILGKLFSSPSPTQTA